MPPAEKEETQLADQEEKDDKEDVGPTGQVNPEPA